MVLTQLSQSDSFICISNAYKHPKSLMMIGIYFVHESNKYSQQRWDAWRRSNKHRQKTPKNVEKVLNSTCFEKMASCDVSFAVSGKINFTFTNSQGNQNNYTRACMNFKWKTFARCLFIFRNFKFQLNNYPIAGSGGIRFIHFWRNSNTGYCLQQHLSTVRIVHNISPSDVRFDVTFWDIPLILDISMADKLEN